MKFAIEVTKSVSDMNGLFTSERKRNVAWSLRVVCVGCSESSSSENPSLTSPVNV